MRHHQTNPYEDHITTIKKRKLEWCGHMTRANNFSAAIIQGTTLVAKEEEAERGKKNGLIMPLIRETQLVRCSTTLLPHLVIDDNDEHRKPQNLP